MKVRFAADAESDLERIADFIAGDNPKRARDFVRELRASCLSLADFPNRFPLAGRYAKLGVRYRVHGSYLIFYRVETDAVVVLRVVHGATDYAPLLLPDDE